MMSSHTERLPEKFLRVIGRLHGIGGIGSYLCLFITGTYFLMSHIEDPSLPSFVAQARIPS